jgi:hypothetical protein
MRSEQCQAGHSNEEGTHIYLWPPGLIICKLI